MKRNFKEHDSVVAKRDINIRVKIGTIGCIMLAHDEENFEVEFFVDNLIGCDEDLLTVSGEDIEFTGQNTL